jgi:hypothetical protein
LQTPLIFCQKELYAFMIVILYNGRQYSCGM